MSIRLRRGKPIRRPFTSWATFGLFAPLAGPAFLVLFLTGLRHEPSSVYYSVLVLLTISWILVALMSGIRVVDGGISVRGAFTTKVYYSKDVDRVEVGELRGGGTPGVVLVMKDGKDVPLLVTARASSRGRERMRRQIELALDKPPRPRREPSARRQY